MMRPLFWVTAALLGRGLLLGLAMLGALACLMALRLPGGSGLVLLLATTGCGVAVLGAQQAGRQRRVARFAAAGTRQAEAWLRIAVSRSGGRG